MQCLANLEKLVTHQHSISWGRELFLAGKFLLGAEQCLLGECGDAGKLKLSFFPSCVIILSFLCFVFVFCIPCVTTVSEADSRPLPEQFLFMDSCLIVDLCCRTGGWGLLYLHFGDMSPTPSNFIISIFLVSKHTKKLKVY